MSKITPPCPHLTRQENEVLVRVKAASINHRDWLIQKGQYVNLKYPIILGSDGAGLVEKLGEGVNDLSVGQEVLINPALNWGENPSAASKEFKILGLPDNGCFAELVSVPASAIYPKPKHLTFEEAAAIPLSGLTGYRALITRGKLKAEQKLLLTGIGGGMALMMLKFSQVLGAKVY